MIVPRTSLVIYLIYHNQFVILEFIPGFSMYQASHLALGCALLILSGIFGSLLNGFISFGPQRTRN